jgi:hypothetical protein
VIVDDDHRAFCFGTEVTGTGLSATGLMLEIVNALRSSCESSHLLLRIYESAGEEHLSDTC